MRFRVWLIVTLLLLFAYAAGATTVSGTTVQDGSSQNYALSGGTICFGPSSCFAVNNGHFTGTVGAATYTVSVYDNTSTDILDLYGVVVSGSAWSFDSYRIPTGNTPQAQGKGVPYMGCLEGARYTITNPSNTSTGLSAFPYYLCGSDQDLNQWYNTNNVINNTALNVQSINGVTGKFQFSGSGVVCTNTTCVFNGGGDTSTVNVNGSPITNPNFNGPVPAPPAGNTNVTFQTSGSNVSGYVPNNQAFNPPDTLYLFAGPDSIVGDDGTAYNYGTAIPISTWSINSGVCTFNSTSAHNLTVGEAFTSEGVSGFPAIPSPYAVWTSGYDLFTVATTPSSTQWTAACPLLSNTSGSGGAAENANYFLPFYTMSLPYFSGHGTAQVALPTGSTIASMFSNYTAAYHPILANWQISHPGSKMYFIVTGGRNDIQACTSASTLKTDLLSVAASVHTDGGIVLYQTITPNPWNTTNLGCHTAFVTALDLNNWAKSQVKTNANSGVNCGANCGKYFDVISDAYPVIHDLNNPYFYRLASASPASCNPQNSGDNGTSACGIAAMASILNDSMTTQGSVLKSLPDDITSGVYGGSIAPGFGFAHIAPSSAGKFWQTWYAADGSTLQFGIDASNGAYIPSLSNVPCLSTNSQGYFTSKNCLAVNTTFTGLVKHINGSFDVAAAYSDVVALFGGGTCSGFLKSDGTCSTPGGGTVTSSGSPVSGDIAKFTSSTNITTATATDINTVIKTLTGCNTAGFVYTPQAADCVSSSATKQWSCQPGLGDGLNAITAGTYLESTCKNTTGSTVTIAGVQCFTDNNGTSTLNAAGNTLGALLTGAVTCTSSFAAGTQSANVLLTNGDYIKFTFVADGTSKQSTWVVYGTY